jgi:hypothetical protein
MRVRKYPTWTLPDGKREGVMTLEELAKATGFAPPAK